MKRRFTVLLLAAGAAFAAAAGSAALEELERRVADVEYGGDAGDAAQLRFFMADPAKAARLAREQRPDGTWPQVDYSDQSRGGWKTGPGHLRDRVLFLARDYRHAVFSGDGKRAKASADAARRGLDWWACERPQCPNWWWNEIGAPQDFAVAAIMIAPELTDADRTRYADYLLCAKIGLTGQNRVWLARIVMMRGILARDEALVDGAARVIADELVVSDGPEGVAPDWSFRQHGPQMQFGNYGLSFALTMSRLSRIFAGTKWAFPKEKFDVLGNLLEKGYRWTVWKDRMDVPSLGRQNGPGAAASKARGVKLAIAEAAAAGWRFPDGPARGFRYFPKSAYAVFRTKDWSASVKMHTRSVLETETWVNGENTLGGHLSDGAMFLYSTGREYDDVFPLWGNWRLVPGVTTYRDFPPVQRRYNEGPGANELDEMDASEDGNAATVEFAIRRNGLSARKRWRFAADGVEATGSGITSGRAGSRVVTCVEHCIAAPNARVLGYRDGRMTFVNGDFRYEIFAPEAAIKVEIAEVEGTWAGIHPGFAGVKSRGRTVFAYIDHGEKPRNASYRYVVTHRAGSN